MADAHGSRSPVVEPSKPRLLHVLGPGLITGASDDDPSGIATYSQTGAQFGYMTTWTLVFSYPLMSAIQIISARLGRTTGHGIAGNLRRHYPDWLVYGGVTLLLVANIINIGADIGAMADALRLLVAGPQLVYVIIFGIACILMQVLLEYKTLCQCVEMADDRPFRLCRNPVFCKDRLVGIGAESYTSKHIFKG